MEQRDLSGVLQISFVGWGKPGSQGNRFGELMRTVIQEALAETKPVGLVLDMSNLEYRTGDWIAWRPLAAIKTLGKGRACLVATGESGKPRNVATM